jgi:hypothetical protein
MMKDDSFVDNSTIISKYIHRFRFEPPSSPSQRVRISETERKAFWWLNGNSDLSYNENLSQCDDDENDDVSVSTEDSLDQKRHHLDHLADSPEEKGTQICVSQISDPDVLSLPPLPPAGSEYYGDSRESMVSSLSTFPEQTNDVFSDVLELRNKYKQVPSSAADLISVGDPFLKNLELCDQLLKSYEKENIAMESRNQKPRNNSVASEDFVGHRELKDRTNDEQHTSVPDVASYRSTCEFEEDLNQLQYADLKERRDDCCNLKNHEEVMMENSNNSIDVILHHLREIYGNKAFEDDEEVGTESENKGSPSGRIEDTEAIIQHNQNVEEAVQTENQPASSDSLLPKPSSWRFSLHSVDDSCQTGLGEETVPLISPAPDNASLFLSSDEEDEGSIRLFHHRKCNIRQDEVELSQNSNEHYFMEEHLPSRTVNFQDVEAYLHDEIISQLWNKLLLKREEISTLKKDHNLL